MIAHIHDHKNEKWDVKATVLEGTEHNPGPLAAVTIVCGSDSITITTGSTGLLVALQGAFDDAALKLEKEIVGFNRKSPHNRHATMEHQCSMECLGGDCK